MAMASIARKRKAKEMYWVVKHGIKMTGMPAWKYRLTEEEIWQVTAILTRMGKLTPAEYAELLALVEEGSALQSFAGGASSNEEQQGGSAEQQIDGRVALQQYACVSCHRIPGATAATNDVGPPLGGLKERAFIAGVLPNTREDLVRWIRFPQQVDPKSAMPNLGVTEAHAQAMVDYLYSADADR